MSKFLTEKYAKLKPYTPGEQPKDKRYIKLNTNESPFPPSKSAQEKAKSELEKWMLYPDPDCNELLDALAKEYGVKKEQIIVTNGSDEVLNFAFMAYCDPQKPAMFPDITYGFYKVFASINNVPMKEIPLEDDFSVDIADYFSANATVFLANPNAPTGLMLSLSQIEEILKNNRNSVVVIDEAYVDFGGESCVKLVDKYDNLLVTQTFSKSRSMAGARLGVGIASKEIIDDLMRIKYSTNPYNVNRATAAAGVGALYDREYFLSNCQKIINTREWTANELKKLGFDVTESKGNFLFARHIKVSGLELYEKLKEKGILIRHFNAPRIGEYIRITIGSAEEMQIFIDKINEIIKESK